MEACSTVVGIISISKLLIFWTWLIWSYLKAKELPHIKCWSSKIAWFTFKSLILVRLLCPKWILFILTHHIYIWCLCMSLYFYVSSNNFVRFLLNFLCLDPFLVLHQLFLMTKLTDINGVFQLMQCSSWLLNSKISILTRISLQGNGKKKSFLIFYKTI